MRNALAHRSARPVGREWARLAADTPTPAPFDPAALAQYPEPAGRWLRHAIAPGTPLWQTVELSMSGEIRLGNWRRFTARQVLTPAAGFIWAARARVAGLPVSGYDRFSAGTGEMRWRLCGLLPVMSSTGPDVSRSAAGRLAGEAVLLPTACLQARWTPGGTADTAVMTWRLAGGAESARLRVGADGSLTEVVLERWGNPGGAPFARRPFGVSFAEETTVAGVTTPSVLRAGWWWGTDRAAEGEFFRARITAARFH